MNSEKKIKNYLKKRIEEEGYPLEIEISNTLEKSKRWSVRNSIYFFDSELKMGRTIDIEAHHLDAVKSDKETPLFLPCVTL